VVSVRQYWFRVERPGMRFDHEHVEGIAELVRVEHVSPRAGFPRVVRAIYWWPESVGREWPARVFPIVDDWGDPSDADPWVCLHEALDFDSEHYRWVELKGFESELTHGDVDEIQPRRLPRGDSTG